MIYIPFSFNQQQLENIQNISNQGVQTELQSMSEQSVQTVSELTSRAVTFGPKMTMKSFTLHNETKIETLTRSSGYIEQTEKQIPLVSKAVQTGGNLSDVAVQTLFNNLDTGLQAMTNPQTAEKAIQVTSDVLTLLSG